MTATLTVGLGCAGQTTPYAWDNNSSSILDIGIIDSENDTINTGFESITISMSKSEDVIGMNITGQNRTLKISGKKTGTLAALKTFAKNLKLIANYQLELEDDCTFKYINTLSKMPSVDTGIIVMLKDVTFYDDSRKSPGELNYQMTLVETKGLG